MKYRNTQSGFFAVGVGLALTALFGLAAATAPDLETEDAIVEQQTVTVPDLVYRDYEN